MSQRANFTHSAPLTADALVVLFDALISCETTREAINEARTILAEFDSASDRDGAANGADEA